MVQCPRCTRFVLVCKRIVNLLEKFIDSPYVREVFWIYPGDYILD